MDSFFSLQNAIKLAGRREGALRKWVYNKSWWSVERLFVVYLEVGSWHWLWPIYRVPWRIKISANPTVLNVRLIKSVNVLNKKEFLDVVHEAVLLMVQLHFQPKLMDGGNYIKEGRDSAKSTCLIFSPREDDEVGSLGRYLKLFSVSETNYWYNILRCRS